MVTYVECTIDLPNGLSVYIDTCTLKFCVARCEVHVDRGGYWCLNQYVGEEADLSFLCDGMPGMLIR